MGKEFDWRKELLYWFLIMGILVTYVALGFEAAAIMTLLLIAWTLLEMKWFFEQRNGNKMNMSEKKAIWDSIEQLRDCVRIMHEGARNFEHMLAVSKSITAVDKHLDKYYEPIREEQE